MICVHASTGKCNLPGNAISDNPGAWAPCLPGWVGPGSKASTQYSLLSSQHSLAFICFNFRVYSYS